jgi:hypothetical protein
MLQERDVTAYKIRGQQCWVAFLGFFASLIRSEKWQFGCRTLKRPPQKAAAIKQFAV